MKVDIACGDCGTVTENPHYDYDRVGERILVQCDRCAPCDRLNFVDRCEGCLEREYSA